MARNETLTPGNYLALSSCLSNGCAQAAAEYAQERDEELQRAQFDHFAFVAHEIRNPLNSVAMAWGLLRDRCDARTGQILERNLRHVQSLIDHSLVDVRLRSVEAGASLHLERVRVRDLLDEMRAECDADAAAKNVSLESRAEDGLTIVVDLRVFRSALSNVVRNAIKFSHPGTRVSLTARAEQSRVFIEVEDACGGLPPGRAERLFESFTQASENRTGFGLGLAIARGAIEVHRGAISVRNLAGKGCVFVIDVARASDRPSGP